MSDWQMNMNLTRSIVALLLLYAAGMFAFIAALANEPPAEKPAARPGTVFRDCPDCPEMVVIPAGSFTMGSSASEKVWATQHGASAEAVSDEAPQHPVSLHAFAIGKYNVTRAEYEMFARETSYPLGDGCGKDTFKWNKERDLNWKNPGFDQSDRDPVVCVSWNDAQAYVSWLNRKVHVDASHSQSGSYRLPSEAEWEYAARAGTMTRFWWGDDDTAAADHAWFKNNSDGHSHPAGLKGANAFGLYDIVGNVWQWTEDCYDNSYAGAPADGRANETPSSDVHANDTQGKCLRVDRGSSWLYPAWLLRSATRERNPADFRAVIMGFRVARALQ
jgi:formylglycine-generating enzyme required for sulfatase activity